MPLAPHEEDGAPAGAVGRPLPAPPGTAIEETLLGDEHARRLHAAHELVRGEEDGVLLEQFAVEAEAGDLGVDVDVDVGRGGGVVPECEGAAAVEEGRDGQVVVQDPSDVGGRDETADDPPDR